jgi:putative membrane protein
MDMVTIFCSEETCFSSRAVTNRLFVIQCKENLKQPNSMKNFNYSKILTAIACAIVISWSAVAQKQNLSDPEVASVAVVANQIDIAYAAIAKQKSKNAEVIKFADTMTNDHNAVIAQASALVKKLNVTPKDNALSQKLLAGAESTKKMLNSKSAKDFDKAYIDNEVSYHKAVISTVQDTLIPDTDNAELKELLINVVPALKTHLAHAEMVQKSMAGK